MAANQPEPGSEWPDFVPPDFEQSIPQAPKEPTAGGAVPPFSGPVLPPQSNTYRPDTGPSGRPRRQSDDRWFSRPAGNGGAAFGPRAAGRTPVTNALIGICVVVWMLQNLSYTFNDLVMLIPSVANTEPWRFLTSAFAHAPRSLTHIGFNMLTLWLMGRYLEPILRGRLFLAIYLISALGGGTLFVLLAFPPGSGPGGTGSNWNSAVVGASGAIFGLFGAYLVLAWTMKRSVTPMLVLLGLNLVMIVLFPGIAWSAHVGGFLTGAAASAVVFWNRRRSAAAGGSQPWWRLAMVVGILVAALVIKYLTI